MLPDRSERLTTNERFQAGNSTSLETIKRCIREVGFIPRQRNVFYKLIDEAKLVPPTDRVSLPVLIA